MTEREELLRAFDPPEPSSWRQLSRRTKLNRHALMRAIQEGVRDGLVVREGRTRNTMYHLTEVGRADRRTAMTAPSLAPAGPVLIDARVLRPCDLYVLAHIPHSKFVKVRDLPCPVQTAYRSTNHLFDLGLLECGPPERGRKAKRLRTFRRKHTRIEFVADKLKFE